MIEDDIDKNNMCHDIKRNLKDFNGDYLLKFEM